MSLVLSESVIFSVGSSCLSISGNLLEKTFNEPYATSVEVGKDQDNQAWGGTCCNYGKVGWTYIWEKAGGYCTFSTYITDTELVYDEVKWSD